MPVLTSTATSPTPAHRVIQGLRFSLLCVIPGLALGCQLERFFAEDVGAGAARLTVRNAAILTKIVAGDTTCGFESEAVLQSPVIDGVVGSVGVATWTVSNCTMDFGPVSTKEQPAAGFDVGDDCNGQERRAFGKVKINAQKIVEGVITGDPTKPVIPLRADAAVITFDAEVENFQITMSASDTSVIMQKGTMTLVNEVHLAVSESLGVCGVDTSEVTFKELTVTDAVYTLDAGDSVFDVEVPSLSLTAQLGLWQDEENTIGGSIRVWDKDVDLNVDRVLDPEYDRDEFRSAYTCKDDLKMPQSYECPDLNETLANGAARLLINDIGNLVSAAVKDSRCGFASANVIGNAVVTGAVGYDGGEVAYTIDTPCIIDLPADSLLSSNCLGDTTTATGTATIKGTMRQRGRVTGDPSQPVIPTSRDAVDITFDVAFDGWAVKSGTKFFRADTGGASGRMRPRLAKDGATGACSIASPVVTFDNIAVKPGTAGVVVNDGLSMGVAFHSGEFTAQVGSKDGDENRLSGGVVVDLLGHDKVVVDVSGALDPEFDAGRAAAAFACTPNLVIPADDAACSFDPIIAENSARLTIQTAGTLASMINSNDDCGFEDTLGVLLWPSEVVGDNGDMGSMTWDVADCSVAHDSLAEFSRNCSGDTTYVEGDATFVDVGRTVRGERDKMVLDFVIDSIIPRDRNAVDINLRTVNLHEFATYSVAAGADDPAGILVIHDGTLSATVQPATANRADDTATYDVATPTARLSSVRLSGTASLYAQGKTFHYTIDDAELLATNGSFLGAENALSGSISVDGKQHTLGALALNPSYNDDAFVAAFACTENLGPAH